MAQIRYAIKRLSVSAMLSYAKPGDGGYTFNLNIPQTKSVIMGTGNTWQEENAIFFQTMCALYGNDYRQPTEDTMITDLAEVILYPDFSGIFDRDGSNPIVALMQKKTEAMFTPNGITLDFGHGEMNYVAFERSANMSRAGRLSFVRSDVYDELKKRMTLDMELGVCQLSKLYAYNGLMFSSGSRIETDSLWQKDAIVVIDNPTAVYPDIDIITVEDATGVGNVRKYNRVEKKTDVPVELFDGEGIISPEFSDEIDCTYCGKHIHNSYQIRMPYIKGMVHEVDFKQLFKEADVDTITDMWGEVHPIDSVKMILTKSQFKGYKWMEQNRLSFAEYLARMRNYRHTLYITGVNRTFNEQETELNYQYISTLSLTEEQFRPKDMPFDWMKNGSEKHWLTKGTEEIYYKYLNDKWFQFDSYVDGTPKSTKSRRYKLTQMLHRNDLLLAEKVYRDEIEKDADNLLKKFAQGNILVEGTVAYLSSDLMLFLAELLKPHISDNEQAEKVYNELLNATPDFTAGYIPGIGGEVALLRNPHIAKNEEAIVTVSPIDRNIRTRYLSHLNGVIMIEPKDLIADRLGGADYDGDMIKVITEPAIRESVAEHYTEPDTPFEDKYSNSNNIPLLNIPTAEPQMRDSDDWQARYEAIKSTFSSRVGQISNAALDRSMLAYDSNVKKEMQEKNRRETETLAILTGLEIDSAKSGIKPDLSEYLGSAKVKRSIFLKYKRLAEDSETRPAWYEDTFEDKMKAYIRSCDWSKISANVEKLPYYAYMLKKHTPRSFSKPAPSSEIFTFAKHDNWKEQLDKKLFAPIKDLITQYDNCLNRIRAYGHPAPVNNKKNDIYRILAMRDQESTYAPDELYALFTDIDDTRIKTIFDAIKEQKWHFMTQEQRLEFLQIYLPEEGFRMYDGLFADFRMGGYRILGDIICDIYEENRRNDNKKLNRTNDTPETTAMIEAYIHREVGVDYREAVANACRVALGKIAPGFQAIRYAEALGRRDFIFDVLLDEADFYLIGGGNE